METWIKHQKQFGLFLHRWVWTFAPDDSWEIVRVLTFGEGDRMVYRHEVQQNGQRVLHGFEYLKDAKKAAQGLIAMENGGQLR